MSTLATQQAALLQALLAPEGLGTTEFIAACPDATRARGLKAYQANAQATAVRALQSSFPVLAQLLGDENLSALARVFWRTHPPQRGDLAQWGAALPDVVRASEPLAGEPYLADVAALEWALHRCAGAPDRDTDPASLGLLMTHDPDALTLTLAPGCAVLPSAWPVVSIVQAHQSEPPDLRVARERLHRRTGECALVWREGVTPRLREALTDEPALLHALRAGQSLGQALDAAPRLDFAPWLTLAVQARLVLGAQHVLP